MFAKLYTIPWCPHCGFYPTHIKKVTLPCYQKSFIWDSRGWKNTEKFPSCFLSTPHNHLLRMRPFSLKKSQTNKKTPTKTTIKTNCKNTNVKNRKASQEANTMYLNLIDDLGGKWSTVLTAWRTVSSQLKSILAWQGKSWDFQHSIEGCLHFPFDKCYREQRNPVCFSFCLHWSRESFLNTLSLSFQGPHRIRQKDSLHFQPPLSDLPLYLMWRGSCGEGVLTHSCRRQPPITARYHWQLISLPIKIFPWL